MKYCCTNEQRQGTCYQELINGPYREEVWGRDSLYLEDDYIDTLGLYDLLIASVPQYDRWGITEVTKEQWEQMNSKAKELGGEAYVVMEEIQQWAKQKKHKETVYTILGV